MSTTHQTAHGTTISRRHLLRTAGVGAAGALALGATGRGARSAVNAAPSRQDRTTVTFWTPGGSPLFCETHTEIAADYGAVDPSTTVAVQCGTGQGFMEQLLGSIAAGNPPDATIVWDSPVVLAAQGALRPLDEMMATAEYAQAANWPAGVLASCQFDGRTYGLPVTAGAYGMWYNQELFEEKGIPSDRASFPKTWDELRRLSKEFTRWDGDRLVTAGYVFADPEAWLPTLSVWSALNGSQIYDAANRRYTIDAEPNVAMMEFFLAWLDEEYKGDIAKVMRSGAWGGGPSEEGQPPEFPAGNLAMMQDGSWYMGDFYAFGEPAFQRWNVAPYPVGPGGSTPVSGYWPNWLVIPERADAAEQAFAYLDYMSGVGVNKWFAAVPDLPTNSQVPVTVPEVTAQRRDPAFAEEIITFFREQLRVATPMWNSPIEESATIRLQTAIERILTKQAAPQDALAEAQREVQTELDRILRDQS